MLISATIFCQDFLNVATFFKNIAQHFSLFRLFQTFFQKNVTTFFRQHFLEVVPTFFRPHFFEVVPTFFRQHFSEKLPIIFQHFS
jgi:hypothetical protein